VSSAAFARRVRPGPTARTVKAILIAADDHIVPIQSRCPACSAAVPSGAAWCSLCHADLRARREPARVAAPVDDVLPASSSAVRPTRVAATPAAPEPEPIGRREAGRHAREPEPVGRREAGRQSSGSRSSTRTLDPVAGLEGIELPTGEIPPEQVEVLADQMLARLAMSDEGPRIFDPSRFPGGKWAVAAAASVVTVIALLAVYSLLGVVFGR
jgi:hypothetical protein